MTKHDNNVISTFAKLGEKNEKALITYVVGGYPNFDVSKEIIETLIDAGADIIEVGIPFSDPMADGPVIQDAFVKALEEGITPIDCLNLVKSIKEKSKKTPLLVMTYSNILYSNGLTKFLSNAKKCNVDGFIIPDLNYEEAEDYLREAEELRLATVFLTSPNTSLERLEKIISNSSGFVYMVSVFGITGSRTKFEKYTFDAISRAKKTTSRYSKPLAVGFGISSITDGKKMIDAGADGIIVGSSLIKIISENEKNKVKMLLELGNFIKGLKSICKSSQ
jgi:tryptophan synthase alpha chain